MKNQFLKRISNAAPKAQIGTWQNIGKCIGTGQDPSCGPGIQNQTNGSNLTVSNIGHVFRVPGLRIYVKVLWK